jgi:hypothetical protein
VCCVVKRAGVLLEPREFPCDLWGYMKSLVHSIPIDTIEVFKRTGLLQQFARTEVCWKGWKNHFAGAFIIVLTITAVTLNTLSND